jgi:hypothetical protein
MTLIPSRPRRHGLRLLATAPVAFLLVLLPTAAHAAVPTAPVRLPSSIEGFSTYQKQTTCSPTAKPGTVKLKNMLLKTYPGTRSLGISRSCSAGGTSEHKEGRAFDWGVRYSSTSERAKANAFLTWLLKTDAAGHKAANARRLGVMYVIWNKRIWGAYAAGSGWRPYGGSNPHTDHVHISLSRAGGAGTVSFWTGRVNSSGTTSGTTTARPGDWGTPTAPNVIVPAPRPTSTLPSGVALENETITVLPTRLGVTTRSAMVRGQKYRVEVRGTWRWNRASGSYADAECSITSGSDWWRQRWIANATGDQLGLYLDGRDLDLYTYGGGGCASASHTYVTTITAPRTGRVPLKLWEPATAAGYLDNSGFVRVRIIHDVARDRLPVTVDTHERWGTTTAGSVVAGQTYTVTASGLWSPSSGVTADAACIDTANGQVVQRDEWGNRVWRLSVNGTSLKATCSPTHQYTWTWTANDSGPAVVRIDSEDYDAHTGKLNVVLTKVTDGDSGGTPSA